VKVDVGEGDDEKWRQVKEYVKKRRGFQDKKIHKF